MSLTCVSVPSQRLWASTYKCPITVIYKGHGGNHAHKDSLHKSNEKTLVSEFWLKNGLKSAPKKI